MMSFQTRKNPIYGNIKLYNQTGELLARISPKRANWYTEKGLAWKAIDDNGIILNFIANGPGVYQDEYLLEPKANMCVVCGKTEDLTTHHVVPRCFKRFFPLEIKERSSYDVVCLCSDCHEKYEIEAHKLKQEIAEIYGVSYTPENFAGDKEYKKAIGYAYALLNYREQMPIERKRDMVKFIKSFFSLEKLTLKKLREISKKPRKTREFAEFTFGKEVVERIVSLQQFVECWRSHFLHICQPKFLSEKWKVNKSIYLRKSYDE